MGRIPPELCKIARHYLHYRPLPGPHTFSRKSLPLLPEEGFAHFFVKFDANFKCCVVFNFQTFCTRMSAPRGMKPPNVFLHLIQCFSLKLLPLAKSNTWRLLLAVVLWIPFTLLICWALGNPNLFASRHSMSYYSTLTMKKMHIAKKWKRQDYKKLSRRKLRLKNLEILCNQVALHGPW